MEVYEGLSAFRAQNKLHLEEMGTLDFSLFFPLTWEVACATSLDSKVYKIITYRLFIGI